MWASLSELGTAAQALVEELAVDACRLRRSTAVASGDLGGDLYEGGRLAAQPVYGERVVLELLVVE